MSPTVPPQRRRSHWMLAVLLTVCCAAYAQAAASADQQSSGREAPPAAAPSSSPPGETPQEKLQDQQIRQALEKITAAYSAIATNFADPVDPEKAIYQGAIAGAMAQLDPFSTFLDPEQFASFQQQERGVQRGFGAVLSVQAGKVLVLQSAANSPFARAGIGPGDRIVSVNGNRVATLSLDDLLKVLEAARSGKVRLSVLQSGSVVARDFVLDPGELPSPSVDKQFLWSPQIGYVHVARVEEGTARELDRVLSGWQGNQLRGLILDLRGNPGGAIDGAVAILSLFLKEGQVVVRLEGRSQPPTVYKTQGAPRYGNLPLVVLINGDTASAGEIIAAALQEHDRGWLVGERTFGKGVAESVQPLSDGSALVLTTARYFTPSGRSVQKPLPGTALAGILERGSGAFFTDHGRLVQQTSGLPPDQRVEPLHLDEWTGYLEQSAAYVNFAQHFLERHGKVSADFRADDTVLGEFAVFLQQAGVAASPLEWRRSLPVLRSRLEGEILSQAFGMAKGDEAQLREDPQVQAAAAAVPTAADLMVSAEGMAPN